MPAFARVTSRPVILSKCCRFPQWISSCGSGTRYLLIIRRPRPSCSGSNGKNFQCHRRHIQLSQRGRASSLGVALSTASTSGTLKQSPKCVLQKEALQLWRLFCSAVPRSLGKELTTELIGKGLQQERRVERACCGLNSQSIARVLRISSE